MKHSNAFGLKPGVFRGIVLALFLLLLVACGSDSSEEPTPTATVDAGQQAVPTLPGQESTPDQSVSEDEIAVITPQQIATSEEVASTPADVATPDEDNATSESDDVSATPAASPSDVPDNDEGNEPVVEATAAETATEEQVEEPTSEGTAEPTERARTGNETFDHPGDGTGGSGMPGERTSNVPEDEATDATPAASPAAQLSVIGCEVPDVPAFDGDTSTFTLTADVNFRSGPGVDCEALLDTPLGEGQTVEVIGGPVIQEEDGTEWVQIEVDGTPGWITTEFTEPAE